MFSPSFHHSLLIFFFLLCNTTAMIFYFATAFEDLSASTDNEDFMDTVRSLVYAFLILGVVILFSMTVQNYLAEAAAETMTQNLKKDWFEALLRQDMAYYDIRDVSGEATIISTNGNRYHRKFQEIKTFNHTFIFHLLKAG
jgi:ATP-binding cassette subfamily B (MDR/TAP) protein 1